MRLAQQPRRRRLVPMPRPKNHAAHIQAAVSQLLDAVTGAVRDAEARAARVGGNGASAGRKGTSRRGGMRGAWTPARRAKLKKAQAAYWANLTPAQHKERIRKMQAGRGLKPKRGR